MRTRPSAAFRSWPDPTWLSLGALACLLAMVAALSAIGAPLAAQHLPLDDAASAAALAPNAPTDSDDACVSCTTAAQRVLTIGMTVSDMERSLDFYTRVLDFAKVSDVEVAGDTYEHLHGVFGLRARICTLALGDERIELTEYLAPQGRSIPEDSRSNDRWFQHIAIIVSDMDAAYARLRAHRVRHASTGPQTIPAWNTAAAGIRAFYFKDPDGHVLEILQFPPDKGRAKWHASDRLFLGIDHTAIVVADTDASIGFYRDALGLEVAGESENYGPEQERLNNIFGARLRITSLRIPGDDGPAIELLEYLAPADGRDYPGDSRASDLWHWQVTLSVADAPASARLLRSRRATMISPGVITLDGDPSGIIAGVSVRDPDGHALRLVQVRAGAAGGEHLNPR